MNASSIFATTLIILSSNTYASTRISAKEAPFHTGENVVACGGLAQTSRFKRGVYLNLEAHYPKQPLTLVVWEDDLTQFNQQHGDLDKLVGKTICGTGTITEYKGRSQIILYNAYSLIVN
ncbi:hypothetical protein L1D26_23125 [Vibrio mediterranei]|uniref:hypothetical protein n=1 Tax=Vibrio mediterranei TaxID=689 RepID=UPI001EFE50F1|nr:hypothetical protein [Vibrio mediterranei]MCG9665949.1 hypothetical protein [Vibrio mediterranei]